MGISSALIAGLTELGVGAETAGVLAPIIMEAGIGAGVGAGTSALTGGKPLMGALEGAGVGALTGGLGEVIGGLGGAASGAAPGVSASGAGVGSATGAGGAALGTAAAPTISAAAPSIAPGLGVGVGGDLASAGGTAAFSPGAASGADVLSSLTGAPGSTAAGSFTGVLNDVPGAASGGAGFSPGAASGADVPTSAVGSTTGTGTAGSTFAPAPTSPGLTDHLEALKSGSGEIGTTATIGAAPGMVGQGLNWVMDTLGLSKGDMAKGVMGAATMGYDLSRPGIKSLPGYEGLSNAAATLGPQGTQLASYITSGTLPAGAQAALDQGTQSAIANIRSNFAGRGMSGSSEEASAIAMVQQNKAVQGSQIASELLGKGIQESSLSAELYKSILNANVTQNDATATAISQLVGALAGGPATITKAVAA
jgi:hypothetical protein